MSKRKRINGIKRHHSTFKQKKYSPELQEAMNKRKEELERVIKFANPVMGWVTDDILDWSKKRAAEKKLTHLVDPNKKLNIT